MIFGGECFIRLIDLIFNIKYIVRVCVCVGIEIGFIGDESYVIIMKNLVFKIKQEFNLFYVYLEVMNVLFMYVV